jgi:signal transduction histidine kinase/HAMP domain-containing protein
MERAPSSPRLSLTARRSVRTDIVAGFFALLAALAVVGGYAVYRQSKAATALRLQNQRYLPLSSLLERLYNNQDTMEALLERAAVARDPAARAWLQAARRTRRRVLLRARQGLEAARPDARAREDRALLASIGAQLDAVERVFRESEPRYTAMFDAVALGDALTAQRTYRALSSSEQGALAALRDAARALELRMSALAVEAAEEQRSTQRLLVAATTVALGFGVVMLVSARRALDPLVALRERVRSVARGDLSEREVVARDDEIGELAREFGNMVRAVRERDGALRSQAEQLRRAERHLEQVVATLRAAVVVVSSEGVVESANPAARALVGEAPIEGVSIDEGPLAAVPGLCEAVRSVIDGGQGRVFEAVKFSERALDGLVVEFVVTGRAGRGALVVLDDVTEREQARSRLLQNERLAAIGRMAAHVTHEVRNPLTSLALNAELLAEELAERPSSPEAQRLLAAMQREVDRLTSVTEEYLRVARLPRPRLEREDVAAVVRDAALFVKPELDRAGVALELRAEGPAYAAVDEGQLRQALLNLLRNAREALQSAASEGRTPTVSVTVERARGGVEVVVEDNGPGLAREVREHLFELFVSTKEKGTGLGLSLTREIIVAHGGTITAESARGSGSGARFVLWLPSASGASEREDESSAPGAAGERG